MMTIPEKASAEKASAEKASTQKAAAEKAAAKEAAIEKAPEMDWRIRVRKGATTDEQAAETCGQCVGAWRADRMVMLERSAGEIQWEGHQWWRGKYGSEMQSNCGCRECVSGCDVEAVEETSF